jgi:tetratricopeptide (TPR) repeat protein
MFQRKTFYSMCLVLFLSVTSGFAIDRSAELEALTKKRGNRAEAEILHRKAMKAHKQKKYSISEDLWYRSAKVDPSWAKTYFNLACATTLQGKEQDAFRYLTISLSLDPAGMIQPVLKDSDLKSLRGKNRYNQLVMDNIKKAGGLPDFSFAAMALKQSLEKKRP